MIEISAAHEGAQGTSGILDEGFDSVAGWIDGLGYYLTPAPLLRRDIPSSMPASAPGCLTDNLAHQGARTSQRRLRPSALCSRAQQPQPGRRVGELILGVRRAHSGGADRRVDPLDADSLR